MNLNTSLDLDTPAAIEANKNLLKNTYREPELSLELGEDEDGFLLPTSPELRKAKMKSAVKKAAEEKKLEKHLKMQMVPDPDARPPTGLGGSRPVKT